MSLNLHNLVLFFVILIKQKKLMNYNAAINFTCYWMVFDPAVQGRSWSTWSSCHDLYVAACGKGVYKSIDNSIQIIKKMSDDAQKHEYKLESLAKITLGDNNVRFY